jgi:hypothetical protein
LSHLVIGQIKILDLQSLEKAVVALGGVLLNQRTFQSYTGSNNPCERAIALPGVNYQVGVQMSADGKGYVLAHDPYGEGSHSYDRHDGQKLVAKLGTGLQKLYQQYARQTTLAAARKAGYMVREKTLSDGSIRLQLALS